MNALFESSGPLLSWWLALCAAAFLNAIGWAAAARLHFRSPGRLDPAAYVVRRRLLWLAAVYVLGCAFRSLLPMIDVPRICLHDTVLSYIVIGRSVATVAELCFAAQWGLLLREAGRATGRGEAMVASWTLMALIVAAELFSWAAVLTTDNLLHAVENSLWTIAATLAITVFIALRPRLEGAGKRFLTMAIIVGGGYVAFMAIVDVPMYLSRWLEDVAGGKSLLTVSEGWRAITQRAIVTRDWSAWKEDIPWLTLYFTVAVWISIALTLAPPLKPAQPRMPRAIGPAGAASRA